MRLYFLRPYESLRAGQTAEIGSGVAKLLIQRGIAAEVADAPEAPAAPEAPRIHTTDIPGPKDIRRSPGRPRKNTLGVTHHG